MNVPSNYFIFIDIFVVLIYLIFIIVGYKKGFLYELLSLVYTAGSLIVSWLLSPVLASIYPIIKLENSSAEIELLSKFVNLDAILNTIIYFVIIFLILKLFYFVLALIFKGMNKIPVIGKFNQILGSIVGILNATLITLTLSLLLTLPVIKNGSEIKNNTIFKYVSKYTDTIVTYVIDNVDLDHIKQEFDEFDVTKAREEFKNWLELNKQ